jgi:hypothetical protein
LGLTLQEITILLAELSYPIGFVQITSRFSKDAQQQNGAKIV